MPSADPSLLSSLPVLHRLALSYAPHRARASTLALLALDARLADVVRTSTEPMLAQLRLAWWRDRLSKDDGPPLGGEPLLRLLASWGGQQGSLVSLIDGWEHMTDPERLGRDAILALAAGRADAFAALAAILDERPAAGAASRCAEDWSIADCAARLSQPAEREVAGALLAGRDWSPVSLPRALRALAVLRALAARAARHGTALDSGGLKSFATMLRAGLAGR